jgi:hypothetical protein
VGSCGRAGAANGAPCGLIVPVVVGNGREASNKAANAVQEAARLFSRCLHNLVRRASPLILFQRERAVMALSHAPGYDPEQEDEDKCEKHERIHRALLALLTNLPERGAANFSAAPHVPSKLLVVVVITDGALPRSTRDK